MNLEGALNLVCSQKDLELAFRKIDRYECGFEFYLTKEGKLKRTKMVCGRKHVVLLVPGGVKRLLNFHTHPPVRENPYTIIKAIPSLGDITYSVVVLWRFPDFVMCIGGVENGEKIVRCFNLKSFVKAVQDVDWEKEGVTPPDIPAEVWERVVFRLMREGKIKYVEKRLGVRETVRRSLKLGVLLIVVAIPLSAWILSQKYRGGRLE